MPRSNLRPRVVFAMGGCALALVTSVLPPVEWLSSIAWRLQAPRTLEVVIVDKTVPFHNYREHGAVTWLLHTMKVQDARGRFLAPDHGYIGFDPVLRRGHDLDAEMLTYADVLFVADTYGVYAGDYERPGEQAALERSPKIYGGLTEDEARTIEDFSARGGMVIGEFNTFASPTEERARSRLESVFGVRWTKWVARYWPNLRDDGEVPRWVGRLYERVTGAPFDVRGGGLVFVHEDSDILVLRDDDDLKSGVVTQERTAAGALFGFPERGHFRYWMDVVESSGSEVVYEHLVDVTPSGERKLAAHGLPRRFPAVTRRWDAWYFAGDFADTSLDLGNPERAWQLDLGAARAGCGGETMEEASFWRWYAPVLARLLASRAR